MWTALTASIPASHMIDYFCRIGVNAGSYSAVSSACAVMRKRLGQDRILREGQELGSDFYISTFLFNRFRTSAGRAWVLTKRLKETSTQSRKKYRASGYVSKQEMSETVLIAIRRLLDGEKYLSPKTEDKLGHK